MKINLSPVSITVSGIDFDSYTFKIYSTSIAYLTF